jgi:hypothetical protein
VLWREAVGAGQYRHRLSMGFGLAHQLEPLQHP